MGKITIPTTLLDSLDKISEQQFDSTTYDLFFSDDLNCAIDFLKQYDGVKATFDSYRREVERLLQWSWLIAEKSILTLKRTDAENYIQFCLDPPKSWIGLKRVSRFVEKNGFRIPNKAWRPFVATISKSQHKNGEIPNKHDYQLSQKAIREIFTISTSFYNYLLLSEKIAINPIALMKQKNKYIQKRQQQSTVMRLTENQWKTCLGVVQAMAKADKKDGRTLFIISALYLLYLRVSELVASDRWVPQMNHFYEDSQHCWWFKTVGKGNKLREIAVSDDMLEALKIYRISLDLSPLPSPNDKTPLIPKEKGTGAMQSTRHVRRLVQNCFDKTIIKLRENKFITEADSLESATVHWLRHTGISDDINENKRPVAHVRDDAGHSSSATTDRYNDITRTDRYQSAKDKRL